MENPNKHNINNDKYYDDDEYDICSISTDTADSMPALISLETNDSLLFDLTGKENLESESELNQNYIPDSIHEIMEEMREKQTYTKVVKKLEENENTTKANENTLEEMREKQREIGKIFFTKLLKSNKSANANANRNAYYQYNSNIISNSILHNNGKEITFIDKLFFQKIFHSRIEIHGFEEQKIAKKIIRFMECKKTDDANENTKLYPIILSEKTDGLVSHLKDWYKKANVDFVLHETDIDVSIPLQEKIDLSEYTDGKYSIENDYKPIFVDSFSEIVKQKMREKEKKQSLSYLNNTKIEDNSTSLYYLSIHDLKNSLKESPNLKKIRFLIENGKFEKIIRKIDKNNNTHFWVSLDDENSKKEKQHERIIEGIKTYYHYNQHNQCFFNELSSHFENIDDVDFTLIETFPKIHILRLTPKIERKIKEYKRVYEELNKQGKLSGSDKEKFKLLFDLHDNKNIESTQKKAIFPLTLNKINSIQTDEKYEKDEKELDKPLWVSFDSNTEFIYKLFFKDFTFSDYKNINSIPINPDFIKYVKQEKRNMNDPIQTLYFDKKKYTTELPIFKKAPTLITDETKREQEMEINNILHYGEKNTNDGKEQQDLSNMDDLLYAIDSSLEFTEYPYTLNTSREKWQLIFENNDLNKNKQIVLVINNTKMKQTFIETFSLDVKQIVEKKSVFESIFNPEFGFEKVFYYVTEDTKQIDSIKQIFDCVFYSSQEELDIKIKYIIQQIDLTIQLNDLQKLQSIFK